MSKRLYSLFFAIMLSLSAVLPNGITPVFAKADTNVVYSFSAEEEFNNGAIVPIKKNVFTSTDAAAKYIKAQIADTKKRNYVLDVYFFNNSKSPAVLGEEVWEKVVGLSKDSNENRAVKGRGQFRNYTVHTTPTLVEEYAFRELMGRDLKNTDKFVRISPYFDWYSSEENSKKVETKAKNIVRSLNLNGLSTSVKIRKISDWFINNVSYDYSDSGNAMADWPLLYGKGVCCEIANAVAMVAGYAGVDIRYVANDEHAWNIVLDGGVWKSLDVTWNICYGYNEFTLVSRYAFEDSHWLPAEYTSRDFRMSYPLYGDSLEGWRKRLGKWYYYNASGNMVKGWKQVKGKWYFMDSDGVMKTGWLYNNGKWYYLSGSGAMLTGFQTLKDSQGTFKFYFNAKGQMLTGWQKISGKWYYFSAKGHMLTGWQTINYKGKKERFYLNANGSMQVGWKKISNKWYFFDKSSGVMKKWWIQDGGKWYYLNGSGVMLTGWQTIKYKGKNQKFYLKSSGEMATGWQSIKGKKYYFNASGVMLTGKQKIGNRTYTFNADGSLKK